MNWGKSNMEKNVRELITDISIENGFFPEDLANCYEKHSEKIDNIISVFDLKTPQDKEIVEAACEIISSSFEKSDNQVDFEAEIPKETKLLVITAFMRNIQFFSMCWNLVILEKNSVSKNQPNAFVFGWNCAKRIPVYEYQEYMAAAGDGMRKFGKENEISDFGKLGQMCEIEDKEYQFYIDLNQNVASKKFALELEFTNADENYKTSIVSKGDGTCRLYSQPVQVGDIFRGIKNLIVKIIPEE